MATNIPPHNLGEVVDVLCVLIHNPEATVSGKHFSLSLSLVLIKRNLFRKEIQRYNQIFEHSSVPRVLFFFLLPNSLNLIAINVSAD